MMYFPPCCWSGSLYIRSSMISSHTARRARAPVSRFRARSAISCRAPGVNSRSLPSMRKNFWYCLTSAFFGSVRMLISVVDVQRLERRAPAAGGRRTRGSSRTRPGLPAAPAPARRRGRAAVSIGAVSEPKPICRLPRRLRMMSSSPTNVPPQMNRICVVSIWMYCCSGCLRPPCGRDVGDRAFEHLQQRLLHAFAADVAGDARRCSASCRSCRSRRCR